MDDLPHLLNKVRNNLHRLPRGSTLAMCPLAACLVEAVWPVRATTIYFLMARWVSSSYVHSHFILDVFFTVNRQNSNATLTCTNVCNQKVLCCKIFSFQPRNNSFSGVDLSRVILVTPTLEFVLFVGAAGADWVRDVCVVSQWQSCGTVGSISCHLTDVVYNYCFLFNNVLILHARTTFSIEDHRSSIRFW